MPEESPRKLCRRKVIEMVAKLTKKEEKEDEFEFVVYEHAWEVRVQVKCKGHAVPEAEPSLPTLRHREKQILKVAEETPHKQKWLADRIGCEWSSSYFGLCLTRLVRLAMLARPEKGFYAITAYGATVRDMLDAAGLL